MPLTQFRDLLLTADPNATHYNGTGQGNYTVWAEYGDEAAGADDKRERLCYHVQVDRYTKLEYDPMAATIENVLNDAGIPFAYRVNYEQDTGYIHHLWDCEV